MKSKEDLARDYEGIDESEAKCHRDEVFKRPSKKKYPSNYTPPKKRKRNGKSKR